MNESLSLPTNEDFISLLEEVPVLEINKDPDLHTISFIFVEGKALFVELKMTMTPDFKEIIKIIAEAYEYDTEEENTGTLIEPNFEKRVVKKLFTKEECVINE